MALIFQRGRMRRPLMLWYASLGRKQRVSRQHLFYNVFGPTVGVAARNVIEREEVQGDFRVIYFKGIRPSALLSERVPDSLSVWRHQRDASEELALLRDTETRVRPDDVVFDIGAPEGIFTFYGAPRALRSRLPANA
jgi:hypothetical protein